MFKMRNSMTGLLILTSLYLLLINGFQIVYSAPGNVNAIDIHRQRIRPISRLIKPSNNQLARIKEPFDTFIVDEDDLFELAKRQTSEDYGHLRFGKRDEFDDYGHMRFGRSGSD